MAKQKQECIAIHASQLASYIHWFGYFFLSSQSLMLLCVCARAICNCQPAIYLSPLHKCTLGTEVKQNQMPSNNVVNTRHKYLLYIIALAQLFFALKLIFKPFPWSGHDWNNGNMKNVHTKYIRMWRFDGIMNNLMMLWQTMRAPTKNSLKKCYTPVSRSIELNAASGTVPFETLVWVRVKQRVKAAATTNSH